jgi:hypothetical protein
LIEHSKNIAMIVFLGKGKYVMENPLHVSKILSVLENEGFVSETLEILEKKIMEKFNSIS